MREYIYSLMTDKRKGFIAAICKVMLSVTAFFYSFIMKVLRAVTIRNEKDLPCKVISVGNLTLGGTGNNKGAILGAFIVWALWSWSAYVIQKLVPQGFQTRAPFIRYVLIGLLLVIVVVKRPKGILGEERAVGGEGSDPDRRPPDR